MAKKPSDRVQFNKLLKRDIVRDFQQICEEMKLVDRLEIERLMERFIHENRQYLKKPSNRLHKPKPDKGIGFFEGKPYLRLIV